jgi:hypothetical protein
MWCGGRGGNSFRVLCLFIGRQHGSAKLCLGRCARAYSCAKPAPESWLIEFSLNSNNLGHKQLQTKVL